MADFALIDSYANTAAVAPRVVVLLRNAVLLALVIASFTRLVRRAGPAVGAAVDPSSIATRPGHPAATPVPDTC